MLKNLTCIYCDAKFSVEIAANFSVICPCCKRRVFLECEYGYGPVTPCRIYLGNKIVGIVDSEMNKYYLEYKRRKIALTKTYLDAIYEAEEIVKKRLPILRRRKNIEILTKRGSLCFYGDWLGTPYIHHKILQTSYDGEILEIIFDHYDRLLVYKPKNITSTEQELKIEKAKKIKWIYTPYDLDKIQTNTITYTFENGKLMKETQHGTEYWTIQEPFCAVYLG